ncbi:Tol-Pal system protein TolB [Labeo rohita]|uniref:Tol-Pal system protein TolB n=1 Tax=Labeo rohita TaxID=84645 RepID=A0ABQ8LAP7_LABRO|nr:Tol-Pal system protein TolB [Labeo rohita]
MAVLQAYKADLLRDLDEGKGLSPEAVEELCRTIDLALHVTKQTFLPPNGKAMVVVVTMERHQRVNVLDIWTKEKKFLLDAPLLPSGLFGTSVEVVVEKFKEAKVQSAALKKYIPRRSPPGAFEQAGPS